MDCPIPATYQPAPAGFSAPNQHRILPYLAHLAARQYTRTPLNAVVTTLHVLRRQLTGKPPRGLPTDRPQTTAQDISAFIPAAPAAGLAPATMKTHVRRLAGFFAELREAGQMPPPPVLRRRHRLLPPPCGPHPARTPLSRRSFRTLTPSGTGAFSSACRAAGCGAPRCVPSPGTPLPGTRTPGASPEAKSRSSAACPCLPR
jgi:hypothetical protein